MQQYSRPSSQLCTGSFLQLQSWCVAHMPKTCRKIQLPTSKISAPFAAFTLVQPHASSDRFSSQQFTHQELKSPNVSNILILTKKTPLCTKILNGTHLYSRPVPSSMEATGHRCLLKTNSLKLSSSQPSFKDSTAPDNQGLAHGIMYIPQIWTIFTTAQRIFGQRCLQTPWSDFSSHKLNHRARCLGKNWVSTGHYKLQASSLSLNNIV